MIDDHQPSRRSGRSRSDEGSVLRQGLVGIGWVALVSALLTVVGALIAVLVSLGY